jgi:CheY-like chemotaxis protein
MLMVEDDASDVVLMRRALEKSTGGHQLYVVHDGEEAVAYLCGHGAFADRGLFPFPNIILTDLKMPRMGGFDLLTWLRDHPECSVIPTIVFTGSAESSDVQRAYAMGANSYMVKPASLNDLMELIKYTYEYWRRCERPPPRPPQC